jgi:16S rRNA (adenine1518-N6/adenine1519-N6)-dimethyltransferase
MNNLTDISVIKSIMSRHGFNFSKGLGQNFLVNPSVCPKIAEMGNAQKGYGIIEIGTGFGVLTVELAKRADKVVAIEIDKRLMPVLDETLTEFNNIKIINEDIMKVDLNKIIEDEFKGMKVAVCANLPYYITSPVIMYLMESNIPIESVTVMVQKEAGERLCAEVGTRQAGAITVAVNYYGKAERLFNVMRGSFMPAPNVDSCVIRIDIDKKYKLDKDDEEFFFKTVKASFSQRRKTLANTVSSSMNISKENIYEILDEMGLDKSIRAEKLDMESFIKFSESVKRLVDNDIV